MFLAGKKDAWEGEWKGGREGGECALSEIMIFQRKTRGREAVANAKQGEDRDEGPGFVLSGVVGIEGGREIQTDRENGGSYAEK